MDGVETEKVRRVLSILVLGTMSTGAEDDRSVHTSLGLQQVSEVSRRQCGAGAQDSQVRGSAGPHKI